MFVQPWEEEQEFGDFVDFVRGQEGSGKVEGEGEVRYAQTRGCDFFYYNATSLVAHFNQNQLTNFRKRQPTQ
jgi:hypothetical protein